MRNIGLTAIVASLVGGAAFADGPRVVVDIAPVHSLVARVMTGVGMPDLLIPTDLDPHHVSLRPSQARLLQEADLVIRGGGGLMPAMSARVATLADGAVVLSLDEIEGLTVLPVRDQHGTPAHHGDDTGHADPVGRAEDGHDDHDDDHGDHGHDDHDEGGQEDHDRHAHDETDHDAHDTHETQETHDHGPNDPHLWLDPVNAALWLDAIARQLAESDPANADLFRSNAAAAVAEIEALATEISDLLAGVGPRVLVQHDAYRYFEARFGVETLGAITDSDAEAPSAARIAALQGSLDGEPARCILVEPQSDRRLADAVAGAGALEVHVVDALGSGFEPGPDLYRLLMQRIAAAMAACGDNG